MNTPAHLIFGMAAFGKPDARNVTLAALAGAMIPDLSLYLLAGTHLFILGTSPDTVFNDLYFSEEWHAIFRVDNSFILWGIVLALGAMLRKAWVVALAGAAILHLLLDFPLHHDDGRAHFWPITNWIFHSPVSYWDPAHFGQWVGALEIVVCLAAGVYIWRRFTEMWVRAVTALLVLAEFAPVIAFALMFGQ